MCSHSAVMSLFFFGLFQVLTAMQQAWCKSVVHVASVTTAQEVRQRPHRPAMSVLKATTAHQDLMSL